MALNFKKIWSGLKVVGKAVLTSDSLGDIEVSSSTNKVYFHNGTSNSPIVTESHSATLVNKGIDADNNTVENLEVDNLKAGVLNTSTTLAGATDDQIPSALATKTYIDDKTAAQNEASEITIDPIPTISSGNVQGALEELQSDIDIVGSDLGAHILDTSTHGTTGDIVGTTDTQTLTNKTISGGTVTGASIEVPVRSDTKQDTRANLDTYALTATNGQIVFATDEKQMFQVVDGALVSIGGQAIVKPTAGETLAVNDLVYISRGTGNDSGRTAGRAYKVDASNDDRVEVLGFVTKAGTAGQAIEVQCAGLLNSLSGLSAGSLYYASPSSPGAITTTAPSTGGQWIVAVGLAASATELVLNPVSSASAIFVQDDFSFTIANNQVAAANVTGLLFDGIQTRAFSMDYSVYRQTDTGGSAVAQTGQLRGVFNTQSSTWFMSDDFSGQNSGVVFSIQPSGQIQYTSSNIAGANYVGTMKYTIKRTFKV